MADHDAITGRSTPKSSFSTTANAAARGRTSNGTNDRFRPSRRGFLLLTGAAAASSAGYARETGGPQAKAVGGGPESSPRRSGSCPGS